MNGLKLFFHNAKYTMLSMFRLKVTLFWTLAFPLLLATFMYMAFGNLFEKDEMFRLFIRMCGIENRLKAA